MAELALGTGMATEAAVGDVGMGLGAEGRIARRASDLAIDLAADLEHTIVLAVLEGLAPAIERMIEAVPRPAALGPPEARSAGIDIAVAARTGLLWPSSQALTGAGIEAGWSSGRLQVGAAATLWQPVRARGADYDLRLQFVTGVVRAGVGTAIGPVRVGASGRLGGRLVWQDQNGARISAGRHWYLNASAGADLEAEIHLTSRLDVGAELAADRFVPYQAFGVDG